MKIDKVKKQLKKVNALFSSIDEEGSYSSIEKDLLKSYIRELYERISQEVESPSPPNQKKKRESKKEDSIFTPPVAKIKEAEILETIVKEEVSSIQNSNNAQQESTTHNVDVIDLPAEIPPVQEEIIDPERQALLVEIYEIEEIEDISDRLSNQPIADLNKAISINEKIFTINELFDGDHITYQDTISHLNKLTSFQEAKQYLISHVAELFRWDKKDKIKKATNFIKIIHRKYL